MDVIHDFAFPLTIAAILGAAGVVRHWIAQVNEQIAKMNLAHQQTLSMIEVMRAESAGVKALNELRFAEIVRRITALEGVDDRSDGYA